MAFVKSYFIRAGLLDGFNGYIIARAIGEPDLP